VELDGRVAEAAWGTGAFEDNNLSVFFQQMLWMVTYSLKRLVERKIN
jgi:hypothetical protein